MRKIRAVACAAAWCALLTGCGTLVDMSSHGSAAVNRRAFVNDPAVNDSLRPALVNGRLLMVLQPGKAYTLKVRTTATLERLGVEVYSGGFQSWRTLGATASGDTEIFSFQSDRSSAAYFRATLRAADGGTGVTPLKVRLFPADTAQSDSIPVRLLLVHQLHNLDSAGEAAFARRFLDTLAGIYRAYGVNIAGTYQIVDPHAVAIKLSFGGTTVDLPGTRVAGAVNMYVIDSIYVPPGTDAGGDILGYAPREAFDLSTDPDSRVILSVRGQDGDEDPVGIANTAAHEMGHFFGFRHTTATALDIQGDDDETNRNDGFDSTGECDGLYKAAAIREVNTLVNDRPYCLRVAANPYTCNQASFCPDKNNLMFPYACSFSGGQRILKGDQKKFLRQNITVFR